MAVKQLEREEKDLHPNQKRLLELLERYEDKPLTVRELQDKLSVASTSVVQHHLKQLIKKGYLKRDLVNSRHYQVLTGNPENRISYLNVYESDPYGNPLDQIPIPSQILGFPASEAFLLRISDNKMSPKLFKGDLAIVQKNVKPTNGDIVISSSKKNVSIGEFQVITRELNILLTLNPRSTSEISDLSDVVGIVRGKISYQIN
jgi:repressor LexA